MTKAQTKSTPRQELAQILKSTDPAEQLQRVRQLMAPAFSVLISVDLRLPFENAVSISVVGNGNYPFDLIYNVLSQATANVRKAEQEAIAKTIKESKVEKEESEVENE